MSAWPNIADLLGNNPDARLALLGAPMTLGAVNRSHYHEAPAVIRRTLKRISTFDVETEKEIHERIHDLGDADISTLSPEEGFAPIRAVVAEALKTHEKVLILGGHNGVTRGGVHGVHKDLSKIGLLTLDAHYDLRSTENGLINGNPVQALLDDGLPGQNIVQIGLAPYANTRDMHETAKGAGITVKTLADCRSSGVVSLVKEGLESLSNRCEAIYVDFDIDVIDRCQLPGAPGGRSGGIDALDFFEAARVCGAHPKVRAMDLTEFDPSLDVSDISALIAARWVADIAYGYSVR